MSTSPFDLYRVRLGFDGGSQREAVRGQSQKIKEITFNDSQSYKQVYVDGQAYDARIIQDVSDTVKSGSGNYQIEFREGVLFYPGTYIEIENAFHEFDTWMLMDVSDDLFFPLHPIKKCVRSIRWVNEAGKIVERWIAFDDTYKLYDGVRPYNNFTVLPDSTMNIFLPVDKETIKLNFDSRFLIDAPGVTEEPNAWKIVNRNAISRMYDDKGVVMLSLGRDQFNHETDNAELMIADYYKDARRPEKPKPELNVASAVFTYKGHPKIVAGAPAKTFGLDFFDKNGEKITGLSPTFEVLVLPELQQFFKYEIKDGKISVAVAYNENVINYQFKIRGSCEDGSISQDLIVKVVSGV